MLHCFSCILSSSFISTLAKMLFKNFAGYGSFQSIRDLDRIWDKHSPRWCINRSRRRGWFRNGGATNCRWSSHAHAQSRPTETNYWPDKCIYMCSGICTVNDNKRKKNYLELPIKVNQETATLYSLFQRLHYSICPGVYSPEINSHTLTYTQIKPV